MNDGFFALLSTNDILYPAVHPLLELQALVDNTVTEVNYLVPLVNVVTTHPKLLPELSLHVIDEEKASYSSGKSSKILPPAPGILWAQLKIKV
jgi:hypothetical protein